MATEIQWDKSGERLYETGVHQGVLYTREEGEYTNGVAWNGLTNITESPSGAEPTALYADNIKYLTLMSVEEFGGTIEAYTYPEEFEACDGTAQLDKGVLIGQQPRRTFGLSYTTLIGNDEDGVEHGYKIHLVYGATAAPSDKAYETINDSPDAITFSWEFTTTPVPVKNHKPSATLTLDSTKISKDKMEKIENILYGRDSSPARLPLPDEVIEIVVGDESADLI